MDKWATIKLFIAAADAGSYTRAARQLGTDPSTISKAVKRLEEGIGAKLFERSTRHLTLSEAGERYLLTARRATEALMESEQEIRDLGASPQGVLRINVPVNYGQRYVVPAVQSFHQHYPEIRIDMHFNDAYVDLIESGFDLAFRTGTLQDRRLVAKKVSPMDFLVCVAPEFLGTVPGSLTRLALLSLPWIRFRFRQTGKLMPILVANGDGLETVEGDESFIVDDGEAAVSLCKAGLGVIQLPHFAVRRELEEGSLVLLLPPNRQSHYSVYMMYPDRRYLPRKTRLFMEHFTCYLSRLGEGPQQSWTMETVPARQSDGDYEMRGVGES